MRYAVFLCAISLLLFLAGCGSSTSSSPPTSAATATAAPTVTVPRSSLKVAFVTDTGGLHDRSFNQLTWAGLQAAHQRYGVHVSVEQSRSVADYVPFLTRAARGADLTIAVGYGMGSSVYQVATSLPKKKFAVVDGAPINVASQPTTLSNVDDILFQEQEAGYLVGVIAGLMEKHRVGKATHNAIGYLGGQPIPGVDHYLAGYVAGAKRVDPTIKILDAYANTFSDAGKGEDLARFQIGQGADILFQVAALTGMGYLAVVKQRGVYGIGVDADQGYLGSFIITSAVKRVDVAVEQTLGQLVGGSFAGGDHRFGLSQGAVGFAPPSSVVPASIAAQANAYARQIISGKIVPPTSIPAR